VYSVLKLVPSGERVCKTCQGHRLENLSTNGTGKLFVEPYADGKAGVSIDIYNL
jgi:hypothetical protein